VSQHHDPVHPEGPHLDAEVIADLRADALDAESAQHARDHLEQCADCRQIAAALDDVDALLADLPDVTAPDDVVDRWLAALAAEPVPAPAGGGATVVPLGATTSKRSSFATRGLAIAASGAGLLLVAALAYPMLTGNGNGSDGGANTAATVDGPVETSPVVIPAAMTSGTQYQPASINTQVSTQLAAVDTMDYVSATPSPMSTTLPDSASPEPTVDDTASTAEGRVPLIDNPSAELACVSNVLVAGEVPILVDVASFAGKAAVVVAVPTTGDPTKMDIWVLARHCTATAYQVLYWSRTDRP
jgi:hypothetical protein